MFLQAVAFLFGAASIFLAGALFYTLCVVTRELWDGDDE